MGFGTFIVQAMLSTMKSSLLAFTLSFFLPGAGLCYLGKWGWGIVNFSVVLAIGVCAVLVLPNDRFDAIIRCLGIGCSGGSAGLAMALTQQINQKMKSVGETEQHRSMER